MYSRQKHNTNKKIRLLALRSEEMELDPIMDQYCIDEEQQDLMLKLQHILDAGRGLRNIITIEEEQQWSQDFEKEYLQMIGHLDALKEFVSKYGQCANGELLYQVELEIPTPQRQAAILTQSVKREVEEIINPLAWSKTRKRFLIQGAMRYYKKEN